MRTFKRCTIQGFVGQAPESRQFEGRDSVVNISLSTQDKKPGANTGTSEDYATTWVSVSFWGNVGQRVLDYVKQGDLVQVSGRFVVRQFKRQDESVGFAIEVNATDFEVIEQKARREQLTAAAPAAAEPAVVAARNGQRMAASGMRRAVSGDEDLPF